MCEADLCQADGVVIFKGDFACLQAINLTAFTTGDLFLWVAKSFCQYSCLLDKWLFNGTAYCTAQGRCHDVRKVWIHQLNLLSQYVDEMYLYQCENYHRMKQKNITPVVLGRRECFYP